MQSRVAGTPLFRANLSVRPFPEAAGLFSKEMACKFFPKPFGIFRVVSLNLPIRRQKILIFSKHLIHPALRFGGANPLFLRRLQIRFSGGHA